MNLKERVWSENGIGNNADRKLFWLQMLGDSTIHKCSEKSNQYKDNRQVSIDVIRSFGHFDACSAWDEQTIEQHRKILHRVVTSVLIENEHYAYYQGFHDIAEFLLIFSDFDIDWTYSMLRLLCSQHLKDFLMKPMDQILESLCALYYIIEIRDNVEHSLVHALTNPRRLPIFILPWILTMFTHSLQSVFNVTRLFDIMLIHPLMPLYIAAAIVIHYKSEVLSNESSDCMLHTVFGYLNNKSFPVEKLIRDTKFLFDRIPPDILIARSINGYIELG